MHTHTPTHAYTRTHTPTHAHTQFTQAQEKVVAATTGKRHETSAVRWLTVQKQQTEQKEKSRKKKTCDVWIVLHTW